MATFARPLETVTSSSEFTRTTPGRTNRASVIPFFSSREKGDFEQLCAPHTKKVLQIIYRITENWEDAEDALQDCLLSAFLHLGDFDGRSRFSTWLTRIGINSALMLRRKRRNARSVPLETIAEVEAAPQTVRTANQDPEKQFMAQERKFALQEALSSLRPVAKRIVEINQLQGYSLEETAEKIGMSTAATKARLFHARVSLRKSPKLKVLRKRQERNKPASYVNSQVA